jgi:hypothetical protein
MIKALKKWEIEGTYLNIIKVLHDYPISNIVLNKEKLKPFHVKSGMWQGCPPFPLSFNVVLEFLARAKRKQKEIKVMQIGKEVKLSLFEHDMILYLQDTKGCIKNS